MVVLGATNRNEAKFMKLTVQCVELICGRATGRGPLIWRYAVARNSAWRSLLVAAILLCSLTFPTPAAAQTISFITHKDFVSGSNPVSVAVGDFNADGVQDLALTNYNCCNLYNYHPENNTVSVLLGNGDGTFQPARTFAVGTNPTSVVAGDFNSDGKLDLAVANAGSNTISVLLGNGDGSFQTAQTFAVGITPWSVRMGDFNNDGKPDLAVANYGSSTVSVLLGNGDGTFPAAPLFGVGLNPRSIAVGDGNGDGRPDLT